MAPQGRSVTSVVVLLVGMGWRPSDAAVVGVGVSGRLASPAPREAAVPGTPRPAVGMSVGLSVIAATRTP
jgi:hypothetical protein